MSSSSPRNKKMSNFTWLLGMMNNVVVFGGGGRGSRGKEMLGGSLLLLASTFICYHGFAFLRSHLRRLIYKKNHLKLFDKSHLLFHPNTNPNVRVHLIRNTQEFLDSASELIKVARSSGCIGMDAEWYEKGPIALLQIAILDGNVYLFRLRPDLDGKIPKALISILEDDSILKTGVGIYEDARKLESSSNFEFQVKGVLDLRHLVPQNLPRKGLAGLAQFYFDLTLDKNWKISASNWEAAKLSDKQIEYAANDALVSLHVALKISYQRIFEEGLGLNQTRESLSRYLKTISEDYVDLKYETVNRDNSLSNKKMMRWKDPSHFKGEHKVPTRKTPLYDNALLEAPDGEPLCTCDSKKADWYVQKNLGEYITKDDGSVVVRLTFEPAGRPEGDAGAYYLSIKDNLCVVCGSKDSYLRKYIVPREYRKFFPDIMRDHTSHDVLLMCIQCHQKSNYFDLVLRRDLADECEAPLNDSKILEEDQGVKKLISASRALIKSRQQIPESRISELERIIRDYYNIEPDKEIPVELLVDSSQLDYKVINDNYISHGLKVVNYYVRSGKGLMELERNWRKHFLKTMKPKYLPPLWSVDHQHERLEIKNSQNRIPNVEVYQDKIIGKAHANSDKKIE